MFTPYAYQEECLVVLRTTRIQGKSVALIVMASGLGKTVTVAFDAKEWLKENKGRVLYLCHQNEILDQAQETFESILGSGYTYGFYTGRKKEMHKADFLFASFQTMSKHAERSFSPNEFAYIIVDESHHSQAPSHLKIVQHFKPKFLLGATATPDRADGLNIRSVFGEEVFKLPLEKALAREGLLTRVDYRIVTDEISFDQVNDANIKDLSLEDIDHSVFIPKRDEEIAASIDRHTAELSEPRIIIFASTIARAEQLAERISGAAAYHSEIPGKKRTVLLEMFRQGMIRALITVDCFNEGIDIPEANVLVFLRSTSSMRIFYQQLGRGLRLSEGKDKVIVLDFVGNAERLVMLKELADAIGIHFSEEMANRANKRPNPFNIKFDEKAQGVLDLVKRVRVKRVADVPALACEYSSRNLLSASRVSAKSWKDVWWKCGKCQHEHQTSPAAKAYGRQCPKCEGQVTDKNNLAFLYPKLAQQYAKENPFPADQIKATTKAIVLWKCLCAYYYRTSPYSRIYRGDGCPSCTARMPAHADNLAFHSPHLAKEYSDTNLRPPENVGKRTTFPRWWVCSDCGHTYRESALARDKGKGCPQCEANQSVKKIHPPLVHISPPEEQTIPVEVLPKEVSTTTLETVWVLCFECGRYWEATEKERAQRTNCPNCTQTITPNKHYQSKW